MNWRVARSLEVLRDQINAAYPHRNKASDGTIGDAAHAASASDHNPDGGGVVRALDITHDPDHGCDIDLITDELVASRDPRISYLIANSLITGPSYGWVWDPYDGTDPHTNHFHLSVVADERADDPRPWSISATATTFMEGEVPSLIRFKDLPHVFVSDGITALWVQSDKELADRLALSVDGTFPLGFGGKVRIVTRRELIGRIRGPVPSGWEDYGIDHGHRLTLTDEQVRTFAEILGARVEMLEQRLVTAGKLLQSIAIDG